ncbi:MAG: 4-hydroxybenzoate octaprenyltransferase [Alphaproteobacteria bacterium]|nr:4-hydroxybenzoate octaprenyltransferase [Alphaproteobacteria bacterium]
MHTDIRKQDWIEKLPDTVQPYIYLMRLDRPIGIWLLLFPGWWSILLASHSSMVSMGSIIYALVVFFIGAVVMRGAGCIINDLWDKNIDLKVERTAGRPLASGALTSIQAIQLLVGLLFAGFTILITLSGTTIVLGILTIPMIISYPLFKRFTYWPQAALGLTFNFGALMGWTAITGGLAWAPFAMYVGCFFWTMGYDTIYAHQDREDDAIVGVKSTALKFGDDSKKWVSGFYAAAFLFFLLAFYLAGVGFVGLLMLGAVGGHFFWQIKQWHLDSNSSALRMFKSNRDLGFVMLAVILSGYIGF